MRAIDKLIDLIFNMRTQLEKYLERRCELEAFHKKERDSYKLISYFEMAFNAGISVTIYFLASSFAFNETSSVIIAVSVAFMLTARFIIQVLGSIEKSILWIKDDLNNISDHSVKGDVAN